MGAPRKHPPKDAGETIQRLAAQGFSNIGIAKHFGVSKETVRRWLEEDESLQEAFEMGREVERQALHAAVFRSAMEGKPANVNAFFILKARFGYVEADHRSTNVSVDVKVQSVMVVKDHGTDEEWAAKAAEQQRNLTLNAASPSKQIEANIAAPQAFEDSSVAWILSAPAPPSPAYPVSPSSSSAPAWKGNT
jgi:hypothetical protein